MSYAIEGAYRVLSVVDQTHLPSPVVDKVTKVTLGWSVQMHFCNVSVSDPLETQAARGYHEEQHEGRGREGLRRSAFVSLTISGDR